MSKNSNNESEAIVKHMAETGMLLLRSVQQFNWVLIAVLFAGSWYILNWQVAQSVFIGGLLANISFFLMRRDVNIFMTNFSDAGMHWKAVKRLEKIKFFLKFYGRLTALGVILYALVKYLTIDMIGLVIGLSTIMISVIVVVLSRGRMLYSVQRYKGA